jgi:hypothetical protein
MHTHPGPDKSGLIITGIILIRHIKNKSERLVEKKTIKEFGAESKNKFLP